MLVMTMKGGTMTTKEGCSNKIRVAHSLPTRTLTLTIENMNEGLGEEKRRGCVSRYFFFLVERFVAGFLAATIFVAAFQLVVLARFVALFVALAGAFAAWKRRSREI